MDKKHSPLNSSNFSNDDNNSNTFKLRRLRIQEGLLLQSIEKSGGNIKEDVELSNSSSYRDLLKKVKDSYKNIKNLYDEVKANTQELFADIDIDDIKKKIFELETNIRIFKSEINSELAILVLSEHDLNKNIIESPNEMKNIRRQPKTLLVNFNTIVASPVRAMMTSPMKCSEVQQFQEFMKNSPNRYGGWNEYNHNLFVKYWQKFHGKSYTSEFEEETFQQTVAYKMFMEEVLSKLQGITANVLTEYVKWYVKYLFHKANQQNAIDKWKWNKNTSRKVLNKVMYADEEDNFSLETSPTHNFIASNFNICRSLPERGNKQIKEFKSLETTRKLPEKRPDRTHHTLMKPTKQWISRCSHDDEHDNGVRSSSGFHYVEGMGKQL